MIIFNKSQELWKAMTQRKWIVRCVIVFGASYLLVGTFVWHFFWGAIVLIFAPSEMTVNDFQKTSLCQFGDWVLDTFQPLVGDEYLIEHLSTHRVEMEAMAFVFNEKILKNENFYKQIPKDRLRAIGVARIDVGMPWPHQPYSNESLIKTKECLSTEGVDRFKCMQDKQVAVKFTTNFGRNEAFYFCRGRGVTGKYLLYFPDPPPKIERGQILGAVDISGKSDFLGQLVPDADRSSDAYSVYREISPNWFIQRH